MHDPQPASKQLVEYALARFSTDNLSCMVVRFDNKALQDKDGLEPIGVEGDPASREKGGISEAEAIVREARKSFGNSGGGGAEGAEGDALDRLGSDGRLRGEVIREEGEKEVGPEANPSEHMDLPGPSLQVRR